VKLPFNTILNIGSGEQITDLLLATHVKKNWESSSLINVLNELKKPETYFNFNIEKAQNLLGYKPLELKEGLELYKKSMTLK
jgi:nucleoside-diphosphate-sugar epimerase